GSGGRGQGGGGRQGGGGGGGGQGRYGAGGESMGGGAARGQGGGGSGADIQTIWKLDANKKLALVLVRLGITDYTYTQLAQVLKGGVINEGDVVVTGMTNPNRTAQGFGGPGGMGRPGMGPGGPGGNRSFGRR